MDFGLFTTWNAVYVGEWLMLDSRVVDVRVLETHHIPFPNLCQESDLAGPYQKSDRLINVREFCGAYNSQPVMREVPHAYRVSHRRRARAAQSLS